MILADNLKKSFDGRLIFEKLSFAIDEGRIVGLYGGSGLGKSTVAKILCGVVKPDEGRILFDGEPLCAPDMAYDRRRGLQIQMVYQQPGSALDANQKLSSGFYELIRYHHFAPDRREAGKMIEGLMEEVGVEMEILNHLPHQISGGEAQRIAIAKCLLFSPRLLILDEATSMLDASTQANIIGLVKGSMRKNNGAVLLISHDKELLEYLCHRVYVFEGNTLILREEKEA